MKSIIKGRLKIGRIAALIIIMIVIMMIFGSSLGYMLYKFNIKQHENTLKTTLSVRENLIDTFLETEKKSAGKNYNYNKSRAKIIRLLDEAKNKNITTGISGEIVLAEKRGNYIVFINRHRFDKNTPTRVPFDSDIAIPMQLALKGKTGFIIAPDYRDEKVLAAYRYVDSINAGIVVKQDYTKIINSYYTSITYAGAIGLILILAGVFLFLKVGDRFTIELNESVKQLETVFNISLDAKWLVDKDFNILKVNQTFLEQFELKEADVIGKKCFDILKSDVCGTNKCRCSSLQLHPDEKLLELNRKIKSSTGKELITQSYAASLKDSKNNFIAIFESFLDITERKLSEQKIKTENELQKQVNALSLQLQRKTEMEPVCNAIISFLCVYLKADIGNFYILSNESKNTYQFITGYGSDVKNISRAKFEEGTTLAGLAVKEKHRIIKRNIPDDYIPISSTLIKATPKLLLIEPLIIYDKVIAVFEIAFLNPIDESKFNIIQRVKEIMAASVNSAMSRNKINNLLEETEKQSEELQVINEELQVQQKELKSTNEELEEQTRQLKDSKEKLIDGQRDLNNKNKELTEKSLLLIQQKEDMEIKSKELEQVSNYKSDFLANMSHELRTPLNSLMILANRLAQNKLENLTGEQIQDAKIIHRQGNELLNLINNILDLSKIEAGKTNISVEKVKVNNLKEMIELTFEPLISEQGLKLNIEIKSETPSYISTDKLRLEQIIKNLVSNAIKFTEKGSIDIIIGRPDSTIDISKNGLTTESSIAISVKDTGIGIDKSQQKQIFEAFQQLDNNLPKKFTGTGLGLSISRELARLMQGDIYIESEKGKGSTFTLVIADSLELSSEQSDNSSEADTLMKVNNAHKNNSTAMTVLQDDVCTLNKNDKVVLLIDNDTSFAKSIYDKCKEVNFKFIHAANSEDGLEKAFQVTPSAIILDLAILNSAENGNNLLKMLKNDINTRHIPIYTVSSGESSIDVLRKGVVCHFNKSESIKNADKLFDKILYSVNEKQKKLLIVEDDIVTAKIIKKLFLSENIIIDLVQTGSDAVSKMTKTNYNCIILDLGLEDISGLEVLKKIEKMNNMSPVVIYTGKELSKKEFEALNKYTDSIIIKSACSEERLIAEVSLFLNMDVSNYGNRSKIILNNLFSMDEVMKGVKVLIVDDDMRNLYALDSVLSEHNLITYKATNGENALDVLSQNNDIEIIIMDIIMPVMNGYECIEKIRKQKKFENLPIIALTAKAMKEEKELCVTAGANDYISKPVDVKKLLSTMRIWLKMKGKDNV